VSSGLLAQMELHQLLHENLLNRSPECQEEQEKGGAKRDQQPVCKKSEIFFAQQ